MSLKDDLIATKATIGTPEKWCKGTMHGAGGTTHCVLGAVALGSPVWESIDAIVQALDRELPDRFSSIAAFNDSTTTTHADIMALFERAIEAAS